MNIWVSGPSGGDTGLGLRKVQCLFSRSDVSQQRQRPAEERTDLERQLRLIRAQMKGNAMTPGLPCPRHGNEPGPSVWHQPELCPTFQSRGSVDGSSCVLGCWGQSGSSRDGCRCPGSAHPLLGALEALQGAVASPQLLPHIAECFSNELLMPLEVAGVPST